MFRLVMPLLLIAAVGTPIWLVMNSDQPITFQANHHDFGIFGNSSNSPSANPISVYSQASFANPAENPNEIAKSVGPYSSMSGTIPNVVGNQASLRGIIQPATQDPQRRSGLPYLQPHVPTSIVQPPSGGGFPIVTPEVFEAMDGQTVVYPGSAFGPDLTVAPMEFVPTIDLANVFRFDVTAEWVKNRWDYVSTSPGDLGLKGLRVGLVTGTNISDLAGSLTYYFDANQKCQRITFRGWSGDSQKLIGLLTRKHGFQMYPSQIAGLHVARQKNALYGALLMKHPPVISSQNRSQRLGMELEMNNSQGTFTLSDRFVTMVENAQ